MPLPSRKHTFKRPRAKNLESKDIEIGKGKRFGHK